MTVDKEEVQRHLEQVQARLNQLDSLITVLESQGESHPQYSQLAGLQREKAKANSQLERLQKLM